MVFAVFERKWGEMVTEGDVVGFVRERKGRELFKSERNRVRVRRR